jgi:ribosomal protein L11 methyltransferase
MSTLDIYIEERLKDIVLEIKHKDNKTLEIFLNKGSSFGSNHTTTSLSIEALKFLIYKNNFIANSLDLGSGSGVLSIMMKKLGIPEVSACEIDDYARKESEMNFRSNFENKFDQPKFVQNPLEADFTYDLVVANISGSFLPDNFSKVAKIINKNGYLAISGFNIKKEKKYCLLANKNNLIPINMFKESPWLSIIFKKK